MIGPNGAGKTTLFRMITGQEQPDAGTLRVGETVELAYVDQSRDALDPDKTVWEEISGGEDQIMVGDREDRTRAPTSAGFNFKGTDQQKKVGKLSGGERNRVHLAKLLRRGGNLLLLDEPTNDLDVDTLRALEEALLAFAGCAVVISHDRWFLDRIATHVLAFEGDSQVRWFEGNFEAYERARRERLGEEADRPHRIDLQEARRGPDLGRPSRRSSSSPIRPARSPSRPSRIAFGCAGCTATSSPGGHGWWGCRSGPRTTWTRGSRPTSRPRARRLQREHGMPIDARERLGWWRRWRPAEPWSPGLRAPEREERLLRRLRVHRFAGN